MHANTSNRVVFLTLGLVLMASFSKSYAFNENFFGLGNSGGTRFPYFQRVSTNLRKLVPSPVTLPITPTPTPSPTTTSSPFPPPPPSTPPPPPPCPLTAAQCNFPACSAIPGCQQCQGNTGGGGGIICIRCCSGWALRQGGLFCDACSQVDNCRTCDPIPGAPTTAPFVRCTDCCPGFGLDFYGLPPSVFSEPRCIACSLINACTSCIDAATSFPFNNPPIPSDLTCTGCAAGFTFAAGQNPPCVP